jgi:hypothetical protein
MLVGREAELVACVEASPESPLEVHGPDGIGKTTLLARVAHTAAPPLDGVVFIRARGYPAADLRAMLFGAFWESDEPFVPALGDLGRWLGAKRALVVLDDVEVEPGELRTLLDAAPGCTFLLGSVEPALRGHGRSLRLDGLAPDAALVLLARALDRPLGAGEEGEAARALVGELGGHPARIVEAAALIRAGEAVLDSSLVRLLGPGAPKLDTAPVVGSAELPALEVEFALSGLLGSWGRLLREALPGARASGDEAHEAYVRHELGAHAAASGARDEAVQHFREAHRMRERLGDEDGMRLARANLRALGAREAGAGRPRVSTGSLRGPARRLRPAAHRSTTAVAKPPRTPGLGRRPAAAGPKPSGTAWLRRRPAASLPLPSPRRALLATAAVALIAATLALTLSGGSGERTDRAEPAPEASLRGPAPTPGARPSIRIDAPRDGVVYGSTAEVRPTARYSCAPPTGARLRSCTAPVDSGAALDTRPGPHTLTVTATDDDGRTSRATARYTVDPVPPTIAIAAPPFAPNEPTVADFACRDALSGIDSCTATDAGGNPVRDGDELPLTGSITVTATDRAGNTVTRTVDYKPPAAPGDPVT